MGAVSCTELVQQTGVLSLSLIVELLQIEKGARKGCSFSNEKFGGMN